jgi:hypothetical protein
MKQEEWKGGLRSNPRKEKNGRQHHYGSHGKKRKVPCP